MLRIEYTYFEIQDILKYFTNFWEYSPVQIGLLIGTITMVFVLWLYVFPIFRILMLEIIKTRDKRKKKNLIKHIALQKDIQDNIELEVQE